MAEQTRRERVARAIYEAWNISGVPYDSPYVRGNAFREGKALAQADAAIAAADAGKPSKEEFGKALDKLIDAAETLGANCGYETRMAIVQVDVDAARREVMRLAGFGEEG